MIDIKKHDKSSAKRFRSESKRLEKILNSDITIEHVGSTAIPGLGGKNIIDILIGVKNPSEMSKICQKLTQNGYFFSKKSATRDYNFLASKLTETSAGDFHIHISPLQSQRYKDFILLRDFLLNNLSEADKYFAYKQKCQEQSHGSRKEYKRLKAEYVRRLILEARKNAQA